jgi:O-antigen biosynthesis protein
MVPASSALTPPATPHPSPKLRIGVVAPRFHHSILGGAELHARWLVEKLAGVGHNVDVFTTCAMDERTLANVLPPGDEPYGSVCVHRYLVDEFDPETRSDVDYAIHDGADLTLEEEEELWLRNGVGSRAMESALAEASDKLDLVLALPYLAGTTYFAFCAAPRRFCLIPCLHDEPYARLAFTKRMLSEAKALLFNTLPEYQLARTIVPDLAPAAVVGLGLEVPQAPDSEAFRRRYGVYGPFAVFVGRLEAAKNVPLLIRYFLRYKARRGGELTLLLVGDGEVEPPPSPHVRQLRIDWADRDAMLTTASILFQPSLRESFSIVMMQAWLCGAPVVAHADGRVATFHCQQSNGGLWFRDYLEFEIILDRLQADGDLAARLGASGNRYVRREYGWDPVLVRFHAALSACGVTR